MKKFEGRMTGVTNSESEKIETIDSRKSVFVCRIFVINSPFSPGEVVIIQLVVFSVALA